MKNSLVAPALIAIFVRGILAKFSHLQQDRGRTTLFDVYKPFLSSAVFHLEKNVPLSEMLRAASETQRLVWTFLLPHFAWNDFIKFALIILPGGIPLVETTALLLGNGTRYAALFLLSQRSMAMISS
ncbi:unnamed protein product [Lasius platythorax]|uniref:Uncharacterized protein n=1 Tax=Lasius platythorax TaxID=488582 RepID=A0AAV2NWV1_9HYME